MRWDTRDYINYSGGGNLYRYAEGNPVRYVDPSGNSPLLLIPPLFAGILLVPNTVGESGSASTWNEFRLAAETALVVGAARGFLAGREISCGKDFRIAPFGNRTGHPIGRLPHYHRRGPKGQDGITIPGQGIGRHRPWERKSTDKSFFDRF